MSFAVQVTRHTLNVRDCEESRHWIRGKGILTTVLEGEGQEKKKGRG